MEFFSLNENYNYISNNQRKALQKEIHSIFRKLPIEIHTYPIDFIHTITNHPIILSCLQQLKQYDTYTYHHSIEVACISFAIGCRLQLSNEKLNQLCIAACLHDIGKIFIDKNIISKPGHLTEKEFEEIHNHPFLGAEYLRLLNIVENDIYLGIITHHERMDGMGYPLKLTGDTIPLFGKIIAIADVYGALTNNRSYRSAYSSQEAYNYILKQSGKQFDEEIVQVFTQIINNNLLN